MSCCLVRVITGQLVKVLEMLGTYNVAVKELKSILSYLYTNQLWAPHCVLLVEALNNILLSVQPDVFFNFSGAQGAVSAFPDSHSNHRHCIIITSSILSPSLRQCIIIITYQPIYIHTF
ncbi:hypothetical protein GBAR_LOCUS21194 [Geodia barretti]|uniref:Uncharacterized protein n=1 Tax=Geodia barretti TaxID=519541 RepID=A0AA35SY24_GEOBA|nr:hypothetical protein GBAR_LOCUS21194 [Geodia barretti]